MIYIICLSTSAPFIKNLMHFWYKKRNLPEKKQEIFGDPLFPTASFDPGLNLEPLRECYVLVENCNDEVEDVIGWWASMMSRFLFGGLRRM